MKANSLLYTGMAVFALFNFACSKEDSITPEGKGTLTLHFDNVAGDDNLVLETGQYTNASHELFTVSTFKYYVSNIRLKTAGNQEYVVPKDESYFLLDESDEESLEIHLHDVPAADYTGVSFIIGIDSLKSVSNESERTGVLATENSDMYWSYNAGYIFFKMEGTSSAAPEDHFAYHIGGYGGSSMETSTVNNIKVVDLLLGSDKATVRSNIAPEIHLYIDVLKIFQGEHTITIAGMPTIMEEDAQATQVADNYATMISYGHVHNDPVE